MCTEKHSATSFALCVVASALSNNFLASLCSISIGRVDSSTLLSRYSKREGMSLPLTEPYVRFSRIRLFKKSSVSSSRYPSSGAVLKCNSSRFAETSDISISPFGHGDSAFGRWNISDTSKSFVWRESSRLLRSSCSVPV